MFRNLVCIVLMGASTLCFTEQTQAESAQKQTAHLELVDVLLKYSKIPGHPPLNVAMEVGDIDAVKLLIAHGCDINSRLPKKNYYLTHSSGFSKRTQTCTNDGQTVLEKAIEIGDKKLIKYFLAHGANPNLFRFVGVYGKFEENGEVISGESIGHSCTAIFEAIRSKDIKILSVLVDHGVDINDICVHDYRGFHGVSLAPLQVAIQEASIRGGNKEMIDFLISKGARI
ncbi:MAG: hypothetical protein JSR37_03690 [Verrucomicrobia bacterium]|nr:hypothetical protein [Verrucomicrobiota bacterium]